MSKKKYGYQVSVADYRQAQQQYHLQRAPKAPEVVNFGFYTETKISKDGNWAIERDYYDKKDIPFFVGLGVLGDIMFSGTAAMGVWSWGICPLTIVLGTFLTGLGIFAGVALLKVTRERIANHEQCDIARKRWIGPGKAPEKGNNINPWNNLFKL